jgi:hypothetical protein
MPIKILKKTENPMASERFYQQRREALIDSGIPANMIDKFNATPNKLDASRILKKRKEKFKKAENPMADERFNAAFRSRMKKAGLKDSEIGDTRFKAGGLSGGQAKLAAKAPPPNKIDAKDFAVLRKEKAKGRGMGLQDESIKPGKVMKAKTGKQIVKEFSASLKGIDESYKDKVHPMKKQRLMDRNKVIKARYGKAIKTELKADPTKPISSVAPKASDILKKNTTPLKALGKVATSRAGALGAILGAGAVGLNIAGRKLKEFVDKKKEKKMGGGMIQKPMGYKSGDTVRKDIKLGRALVEAFGSKKTINKMKANIQDQNRVKKYSIGTGPLGATKKRLQQGPSPSKQPSPDKPLGLAALPSSDTELKNTINQVKAKYASLKETARDELTPMKSDRVFSKFRRPDSAKEFYADKSGSKYEGMAKDAMQNRINYHKNKKMVGGMAKKYSVGGGADIGAEKKSMKDTDIPTRRSRSPQNLISNKEMRIKSLRQSATPGYLPKPAIGKMGGGMMQRPMGYKSGTMVKARGCKLGRTRPTKMY